MSDDLDIRIGSIFDGKYEIVELLGAGGMGQVFKARHLHLNSFRTIKVMRKNIAADAAARKRFSREARVATRVHHRNVAVVHDFSTAPNGSDYIVCEFIDGATIRQWSAPPRPFSLNIAIDIALQILDGLDHLHTAGILHRDLSPDNVMITNDGGRPVAKIIDLGLAKILTETPSADSTTRAGLFMGNPRYSSPEQLGAIGEGEEIDARADLYSFGVLLYELLTGVPPFIASTPQGYAVKHLTEAPPPLMRRPGLGDFPPGLQAVVGKALRKERDERYRSAKELAAALAPFREATLEKATEPGAPPPSAADVTVAPAATRGGETPPHQPAERRRSAWLPIAGAVAGLLAAAAIVAVSRMESAPAETATTTTVAPAPVPAPLPTPVPGAPLVTQGNLSIDATPWARVASVHDGTKEWISNATGTYTPHQIKLPVGSYTVTLFGPDGTRHSSVVAVASTEPAFVHAEFHESGVRPATQ